MTDELPEGWGEVPLGDCVDILDNRRVPVNSDERAKRVGKIPYYGATGQVGWIDDSLFDEPLVLLGEDGAPFLEKSKPIAYLISGKSWVNNHAHVLRAKSGLTTNEFIKLALDAHDFHGYVNGTTRLKLTQSSMVTIPVRLPPLPEQRRIVAKVESLLSEIHATRSRLAKSTALLKRFRQSVLAAACDGRLTEGWRGTFSPSESASSLLNKVLEERRSASQAIHPGSKYKEPECADLPDSYEIPESWCLASGQQLFRWASGASLKKRNSCLARYQSTVEMASLLTTLTLS